MLSPNDLPRLGPLRLPETSVVPALLRRLALAAGLILLVVIVLWLDRDGLRDTAQPGNPPGFIDVFYYTVVSLSTVGYGDISPITTEARLVNALVLTPIRLIVWVLFLGTAYELTVLRLRYREERQMSDLHDRLNGHVIVCGYGVKGRAIVDEMVAHGQDRDQIVIIDPNDEAVEEAGKDDLVAFRGDASSESLLRAAAVERAAYVMAAPNRDDSCVLICLTVRSLAPDVRLIAAAREEENVKLIYSAGADLVVTPSVSGGRVMASAVHQHAVPHFLEDVLAFGEGLTVAEYVVRSNEAGRLARDLPEMKNDLVLGMMRGKQKYPFYRLSSERLQPGDVVVYLSGDPELERDEAPQ